MPRHTSALLIALTALLMGCTGAPETALTQPLVDLLSRDDVEVLDSPTARTSPECETEFPNLSEAAPSGAVTLSR